MKKFSKVLSNYSWIDTVYPHRATSYDRLTSWMKQFLLFLHAYSITLGESISPPLEFARTVPGFGHLNILGTVYAPSEQGTGGLV